MINSIESFTEVEQDEYRDFTTIHALFDVIYKLKQSCLCAVAFLISGLKGI